MIETLLAVVVHPLLASLPLAAPTPTACPSANPGSRAVVSPCPSATPLKVIGNVAATGRNVNLVGKAPAASTGTINQEQIAARPILRPAEVLEAIPGLVITQHSGGGKANQYYLRGFQLDHGTDLESTVVGAPVNLPTHAHGQGYSDLNWLIPELVSYVEYKKGPYYADQGDFSTAGSYNLYYRNTTAPTSEFTVGPYNYGRLLFAGSPKLGAGNLLYAFEYVHDNSTLNRPDNYRKFNGVLRWSRSTASTDFNVTAMAYNGAFDSSDQIPQRLVDSGAIDRFGLIDPSDGGQTYRLAVTSQLRHQDAHGVTQAAAYGYEQQLDLFSNFTYFLDDATDYYNVTANPQTCTAAYTTCSDGSGHISTYSSYCPGNNSALAGAAPGSVVPRPFSFSCGDQREQLDKRFVSGFNVSRTFDTPATQTSIGAGLRNDNIAEVGLFLTHDRVRYANGTLGDDHVVERDSNLWAQSVIHAGHKLRVIPGLRADLYYFNVMAPSARNSGRVTTGIVSPKLSVAYEISPHQEAYVDFGDSFHSNDGRGITQTLDPQTHAPFDSTGAPVQNVSPLVRAAGEEVGYRYSTASLNSSIALFALNVASELIFDGDHGTTFAGRPTVRRGVELSNFFTPTNWLTIDADYATATAQFLTDPDHIGRFVPESLAGVLSAGITVDKPHYITSLRMLCFGPRTLVEDGSAVSPSSTIFNGLYTAKLNNGMRLGLELLNMFNAQTADVTYYYGSWLPQDVATRALARNASINPALGGSGVDDYHFHPSEARTFRLTLAMPL